MPPTSEPQRAAVAHSASRRRLAGSSSGRRGDAGWQSVARGPPRARRPVVSTERATRESRNGGSRRRSKITANVTTSIARHAVQRCARRAIGTRTGPRVVLCRGTLRRGSKLLSGEAWAAAPRSLQQTERFAKRISARMPSWVLSPAWFICARWRQDGLAVAEETRRTWNSIRRPAAGPSNERWAWTQFGTVATGSLSLLRARDACSRRR